MWKEILGDGLLIGSGLALLFIFISIAVTGGYMAVEENALILYVEIGMGAFITIMGIDRFINDLRKKK